MLVGKWSLTLGRLRTPSCCEFVGGWLQTRQNLLIIKIKHEEGVQLPRNKPRRGDHPVLFLSANLKTPIGSGRYTQYAAQWQKPRLPHSAPIG